MKYVFKVWEATMTKNGVDDTIVSTDINVARNHFWGNTQDDPPLSEYQFTMKFRDAEIVDNQ